MGHESLKDVIERAERAAREGRSWDAVKELFDPEVIGRLEARLRRQWSWITVEQVEDAIADAYVALYSEIGKGGKVRKTVAWLAEVAYRRAADAMRKHAGEDSMDPSRVPGSTFEVGDPERTEAAYSAFGRLVQRLTPEGVKRVMEIIVEALHSGVLTLTNANVAEVLGEHPENVKKWRQRGFKKLRRMALEEGLVDDNFELTDLIYDPDEENSDHDDYD